MPLPEQTSATVTGKCAFCSKENAWTFTVQLPISSSQASPCSESFVVNCQFCQKLNKIRIPLPSHGPR